MEPRQSPPRSVAGAMTGHRRLTAVGIGALAPALVPAAATAHGEAVAAPTFPGVLLAWSFDPLAIALIGAAALVYLRAVREVNAAHPHSPVPGWRTVAYLGGLAAITVALLSPIERYETALLSVHMVQHMLLQFVAAPLLLLAAPVTLALRVASPGARGWLLTVLHSRLLRVATHPLVAWTAFVAVNWGWQFSPLYDLAAESTLVHYVQHAVYLGVALLFWWPIVAVDPAPRKLAFPGRVAYVALSIPQNSFLGITLMNVQPSLYPHYWTQLRDWGPPFAEDLQIAGAIMWGMGAMVFVVALLLVLGAWMRSEERRTRRTEARTDEREAAEAAIAAYRAGRDGRR
jgi:cytochrome c oxidase assembly factor CtaG